MKTPPEQSPKPVLRLIKGGEEPVEPQPSTTDSASKSALVSFMQNFADSIDRDVRLLLEI